ncbi:family S53 protease [Multifurca ochricompacta]|uniref:tripeptidyl-peptidase II n=1 Tax=Multifurca ochricompacta TaxID=376703 RepID=A0AAD4LXI2_9AGAM|nr:family S53 protease [Multifurca ochricompacta]
MTEVTLVLASVIAFVSAKPQFARDLRLHEHGVAADDTPLRLRLSLVQSDIKGLQDKLLDVSTPSSSNYGKHLSEAEVGAFVTPKPETVAAVNAWLSENGLNGTSLSPFNDWIGIQTTVGQANELFATQFSEFTLEATGETAIRTLQYSIPSGLKGHLELVHPTITFPGPRRVGLPLASLPLSEERRTTTSRSDLSAPASWLYGIPKTLATQSSNQLAVSGFIGQYANAADLQSFLKKYRTDLSSSTTFTLQTLDGGSNPQGTGQAGVEADLDVQYTIGVASGVPTVFISVGNNFQDGNLEGFLDIINFLLKESKPPSVLTTSYGEDESNISPALANQLCNAYAQLGARGTSILFASGDGGVSGSQSQSCSTFVPTFPSGCPFMTSVGATQNVDPEIAADLSSGGFSNIFGIPSYQQSAVSSYLQQLGSTNDGLFNASGRAYPDVAAFGHAVEIVYKGKNSAVDGTSCASPIFASVIALLNDRLIAAGKSPLGFLNPWLYSTGASALNDITSGSNPGCGTSGFPARRGGILYVTGLGSPNFPALLSALGLS